ncbi:MULTISPECIES: transposase [unclassified Stenotrophomonas]|uniref:transposase n=1 Tax=unclassified Stenotrophomonas TaxID=196198 RepID=UPI000D150FE0|nr:MULTISPECIES: transposase [unclassified Stenotrophomonas]PTA70691.1 hypothetical protein C9412_16130 [Stenotrophomonas sp. Nf1]PTA81241.1 hypothetical protein C9416_08680 [Stenotrophomonas sp. Nf4]
MLRIHPLLQWYALSDSGMEEALHEICLMRQFARIGELNAIPDNSTTRNFRRLLERHGLTSKLIEQVSTHLARKGEILRASMITDATIIHAPSSTKSTDKAHHPEMHNIVVLRHEYARRRECAFSSPPTDTVVHDHIGIPFPARV